MTEVLYTDIKPTASSDVKRATIADGLLNDIPTFMVTLGDYKSQHTTFTARSRITPPPIHQPQPTPSEPSNPNITDLPTCHPATPLVIPTKRFFVVAWMFLCKVALHGPAE